MNAAIRTAHSDAPGEATSGRASRTRLFAALPRLSGAAVAVRNRVYATAPVLLADERVLIWQEWPGLRTSGALALRLGGAPLTVAADNLARIEPRLEGFDTFLPTELCGVLVEHALSPVIALLERFTGQSAEFEAFHRDAQVGALSGESAIGFAVLEADLQPQLRGWVRAAPEVWQQMDFARAVTLPCQRVQQVPVRLSLQFGSTRLRLRELRALAAGDALRTTPRIARDAQSLTVLLKAGGSGFFIRARVTGDALTLEHIVNTAIDNPSQAGFEPSDDASADDSLIDDIECDVTFELGSLRLKVADIGRLRAGQTLRLGVRLQEQPVRVMVNGRWIARGELAAVGDELVVVVTDTSRLPPI